MPASRVDLSIFHSPSTVVVESRHQRQPVPAQMVRLDRNGVEFRSKLPFQLWTEMTVRLDVPGQSARQEGTGVVVACEGNRHQGYTVSVLFLGQSGQGAERPRWGGRRTLR
jgi:hypothetical protein